MDLVQGSQVIQEVIYPLHVGKHIVIDKPVRVGRIVYENHMPRIASHEQVSMTIYSTLVQAPTHRGSGPISVCTTIAIAGLTGIAPFTCLRVGFLPAGGSTGTGKVSRVFREKEGAQVNFGKHPSLHLATFPIGFNLHDL